MGLTANYMVAIQPGFFYTVSLRGKSVFDGGRTCKRNIKFFMVIVCFRAVKNHLCKYLINNALKLK
jgi:hypothetical protein